MTETVVRIVDSGYCLEAFVYQPLKAPQKIAYAVMDTFGWALMARAGTETEISHGVNVRALATVDRVDFDPPGVTTFSPVHTPRGVAHDALVRLAQWVVRRHVTRTPPGLRGKPLAWAGNQPAGAEPDAPGLRRRPATKDP